MMLIVIFVVTIMQHHAEHHGVDIAVRRKIPVKPSQVQFLDPISESMSHHQLIFSGRIAPFTIVVRLQLLDVGLK